MIKNTRLDRQAGFTLIELMIVIAILAILLSIAIPAYQNYSIRAQNTECLSIAGSAKAFISETVQSQGVAVDSGSVDLSTWTAPAATENCSSVAVADGTGVITVTTSVQGSSGTFTITPSQASLTDAIQWNCTAPGVPANHAPASCRGS